MASSGLSRQHSTSDRRRDPMVPSLPKGKNAAATAPFEPCASTGSLFLYAQGSNVLCLHHDSLAIERRFQKHTDTIQLIAVDNVSETGAGRLVVTYDARQTAIVWDLFTGDQISRFASYEPLKVASWMRNGNIAFGNGKGEVILFEPSTSEHVSARTIFDPITALAPSSDCKTYAIGYNNGSILLAALQPSFTILHTLTTPRAPSPIASLTWHASSSKQKSDMLATQTADGDLRVWSVSKPPTSEQPRVIRVLKRPDPNFISGRTWIAWSKNGRVVQYSESETWAWDVRTKDVKYEMIPVVDGVRGIAAYGPSASLFTLGPDYTIQQYDIEQGQIVQNIRNMPTTIPPTPPEENKQLGWTTSGSEDDASPVVRHKVQTERNRLASPQSSAAAVSSFNPKPPKHNPKPKDVSSPARQSELTGTTFSAGSQPIYLHDQLKSPASSKAYRKASRLRQEVIMSPEERPVDDLFPYTRSRLNDVPYKNPRQLSDAEMTPDNLRRQMLETVFGWKEDIRDLVREELSMHPPDSQHAIFLSIWLNEDDSYLCEVMGQTSVLSTMDWMMLALGTMDHSSSSKRICQVFIEKMLSRGDIHAAVATLLCLGDRSDAIEVYVSRNQYLEAVLLTCLVTPSDWQRQCHLVRRWGEHVVENSQQQLAMRCFSCTGVEPTEPWTSPTAAQLSAQPMQISPQEIPILAAPNEGSGTFPEIYRKTLERRRTMDAPTPVAMPAPPTPFRTAAAQHSRITPQTSALKLITSFGVQTNPQYKFPGLKSEDYTPTVGATVTPIAESAIDRSAISPGGSGSYRQNNVRSLNAVMSARTPSAMHKHRLPSIGETPVDVDGPSFKTSPPPPLPPKRLPTPGDSQSDVERRSSSAKEASDQDQNAPELQQSDEPGDALLMLTPAVYNPPSSFRDKQTPKTAVRQRVPPVDFPSHSQRPESRTSDLDELAALDQKPWIGSKSKKPDGLSIQMTPIGDYESSDRYSGTRTGNTHSTTQFDTNSEVTSPPRTGESYASRTKSPSFSGRNIDQYISSLEQTHYYNNNARSRETASQKMSEKRSRPLLRRDSDVRDDRDRTVNPAKRSPSSPVPMSPEDLRMYTDSVDSMQTFASTISAERGGTPASRSRLGKHRAHPSKEEAPRQRSRSAQAGSRTRHGAKGDRRGESPERRSRSKSRKEASGRRSPSSPLPMVPSEEDRNQLSDPSLRLVSADRQHRSREPSSHRDRSNERRKPRHRSRSRQTEEGEGPLSRKSSISTKSGKNRRHRDDSAARSEGRRQANGLGYDSLTGDSSSALPLDPEIRSRSNPQPRADGRAKDLSKGIAAAELEARRLSLARRPSAPNIPLPGQAAHGKSASESHAPPLYRANTDEPGTRYGEPRLRRPSTPRAMQVTPGSLNEHQSDLDLLPRRTFTPKLEPSESPRLNSSQTSKPHSRNASRGLVVEDYRTAAEIEAALAQLPRHPAYDHQLSRSRDTSRNRDERSRGASRDRLRVSPRMEEVGNLIIAPEQQGAPQPPILPELQHLVSPPPPPPPPAPPKTRPSLSVRTDSANASRIPLPPSANPVDDSGPSSAHPGLGHRRGRSANGGSENQFMGKIKNFAGKMRSASQNRDNAVRSPPQPPNGEGFQVQSPYETNTAFPHQSMQV
ncbi:uncharacterized protein HMPREF1541_03917 [Cyphellophora europaea CBS 101466]|uniref:Gem-associated protein 5 TPR domain-containing protein n=1 Tax=Cyphellophora europaea (strain CBS 101466) TaxID=1220924 RepID=W2S1R0_CYPE1|nr:uncharacterized protein HMPREF1541_03917 [Cyphellophora europaea CBS 101466]ETN41978.1 hypothetical protein HMPREF1541_03917 [Cyphellophora europaea CBS 101466]